MYLRYKSTIGLYRLKCNNEHGYPKTQVTNQQIKAQAVPPFCVFFSKLLLKLKQTNTYKHQRHEADKDKQHAWQKHRLSEHEQPLKGM